MDARFGAAYARSYAADQVLSTLGSRTVRYVLTDGDGGTSANYDTTVTMAAVNDAPVIANLGGDTLAYTEGDGAQVIEQSSNAAVTDVDSADFDTGTLTVSFTAGSDSAEDVLDLGATPTFFYNETIPSKALALQRAFDHMG